MDEEAVSAERLHELRVAARRLVDECRYDEAMRGYVAAADLADALRIRVEAETLRSRARQVVVLVWARANGHDVWFDDVAPVYAPVHGVVTGVARRFVLRVSGGDELVAIVDSSDRVRLAPRRKSG